MHWCRFDYQDIDSQKKFSGSDAFCDENGHIDTGFSRMFWQNIFSETSEVTTVTITITVNTFETLEKILAMTSGKDLQWDCNNRTNCY